MKCRAQQVGSGITRSSLSASTASLKCSLRVLLSLHQGSVPDGQTGPALPAAHGGTAAATEELALVGTTRHMGHLACLPASTHFEIAVQQYKCPACLRLPACLLFSRLLRSLARSLTRCRRRQLSVRGGTSNRHRSTSMSRLFCLHAVVWERSREQR